MDINQTQNQQKPEFQQSKNSQNNTLKMVLFFLGIIILVGVAWSSYRLGYEKQKLVVKYVQEIPTQIQPKIINNSQISPTLANGLIFGGASGLNRYNILIPNSWQITRTIKSQGSQGVSLDDLELERNVFVNNTNYYYKLNITEGGGDGGVCSYPDNKITVGIVHGDYPDFTEFKDQNGVKYRRGFDEVNSSNSGARYTICQLGKNNFYVNLTSYGWIVYNAPVNPDKEILSEMDSILSTIKSQ